MRESVIYQEILQEGKAEGKAEGKSEVALNLLREGMTLEQVARLTNLSLEQVRTLQNVNKLE